STGLGATFDCKYSAMPIPDKIKDRIKQNHCPTQVAGTTTSPSINNQVSIPIPVISEVIKAKSAGRFRSASAFPRISVNPATISQLPTESPNVRNKPTKSASNGEVPNWD